jgi:hypothetical protein
MTGITSANPSLVDANVVAQRYDQLLKQFHGNAEQAMMALQQLQGPQGMVPLSELFLKFQNLKKQQQQQPVNQNTINAQLSQEAASHDQGVAGLPAHNVGGPNAYAGGGIVSFAGPMGSLVGGGSSINPMSFGGLDLETLDAQLTQAGYDPESKAEMLRRAAASRARTGAAPSSTRTPYSVDSNEEILKRAATQRAPVAAGEVAAPAAEGAAAEAAPGMLARLGGMAGRLFSGARGLGILGLLHSPDTAAQSDEMMLMQKNRAARGLPGVYAADASAAPTAVPPPPPVEAAPAKPAGSTVTERTSISLPKDPTNFLSQLQGTSEFENFIKTKIDESKPKDFNQYVSDTKNALGPNKAADDYKKYVDTLDGTAKINAQNDLRMAKAAAFFNMAAAAGKPGQAGSSLSKFLNSATVGGMSYTQAEPRIRQGLAAVQQKIAEDRFKLADSERKENADIYNNARREYGADQRTYATMVGDLTKFQISERANTVRAQVAELNATARATMQYKLITNQTEKLDAAAARTALTDASRTATEKSKQLLTALNNPMLINNPAAYEQLRQEYTDAIAYEHAVNTRLAEVGGITMPKSSNIGASSITTEMKRRGLIK